MAPELEGFISEELHREGSVLKERRKMREERGHNRGAGAPRVDGPSANGMKKLQQKIAEQEAELRRLRAATVTKAEGDGEDGAPGPSNRRRRGGK